MGKIIGYFLMPHPPIMLPEIGRGEDDKVINTKKSAEIIAKKIKELKPDTIIVITPHGPLFRDAIAISQVSQIQGDFGKFGHPEISFNKSINLELTDEIISNSDEIGIPVAPITINSQRDYNIDCELDHGTMVPLYFVDSCYTDYKIVHITYGALTGYELYRFGKAIQSAVNTVGNNVVVIASGDLSHRLSDRGPYEYNSNGTVFDDTIIRCLKAGDVIGIYNIDSCIIEGAGECALRTIYILMGVLSGRKFTGELYSYEGPFGVGYGVMSFQILDNSGGIGENELDAHRRETISKTRRDESVYVRLARESLSAYLKTGQYLAIPDYVSQEMLNQKRGTFVSMKKGGELRGCIGTILPATGNVAYEIIRNAVEAGLHDPRFYPVEIEEIEDIVFSVDVLSEPEKAERSELNPFKYGVIVSKGARRGLLLPDLEGVDTVEKQLEIALRKGGIEQDSKYQIEKFEVTRYK